MTLDQIVCDEEFPDCSQLLECSGLECLDQVSDMKGTGSVAVSSFFSPPKKTNKQKKQQQQTATKKETPELCVTEHIDKWTLSSILLMSSDVILTVFKIANFFLSRVKCRMARMEGTDLKKKPFFFFLYLCGAYAWMLIVITAVFICLYCASSSSVECQTSVGWRFWHYLRWFSAGQRIVGSCNDQLGGVGMGKVAGGKGGWGEKEEFLSVFPDGRWVWTWNSPGWQSPQAQEAVYSSLGWF